MTPGSARSVLALLLAAAVGGCAHRPEILYLLPPHGASQAEGHFEVGPIPEEERRGLPDGQLDAERAAELFVVRVLPEKAEAGKLHESLPAVAGEYELRGGWLQFEPRFPLTAGVRYLAQYRPGAAGEVEREVTLPAPDLTPVAGVAAVYPSADELPENLLKFYIQFSAPMSRRQAWDHLRLLDSRGHKVEMPFLELDEELWDRSGRRLTVFIDPGRIKRGVKPLEDIGPALIAGNSYVLEVDHRWEDAGGRPLRQGFRKPFRVGPPDRASPNPAGWKIAPPPPGARDPLTVSLGESLDHGLLLSNLAVEGPGGARLAGEIRIGDHERSWSFIPEAAWADGEHQLVAATTLEDLAGNSVGRPFEVDLEGPVQKTIEIGAVRVPFRPVGSAAKVGEQQAAAGSVR